LVIHAFDPDEGLNGQIRYKINGPMNGPNALTIDGKSGNLNWDPEVIMELH
jgi:hypothetical protein